VPNFVVFVGKYSEVLVNCDGSLICWFLCIVMHSVMCETILLFGKCC